MVNHLKFKSSENKIYFSTDLHILHSKDFILNSRGFKNVEEATHTLISNWNSKIDNNSIVFYLGDLVCGGGNGELNLKTFKNLLNILNYKELYLMGGNHFSGYRQLFNEQFLKGNQIDQYYRLTFSNNGKIVRMIPNYYEIIIDKIFMVLCHYGLATFNFKNKGGQCIVGHSHHDMPATKKNGTSLGKILDVAPDGNNNFPYSFEEVQEIMNKKPVSSSIKELYDHH